jgi:hypothetical protein
VHDSFAAVRSHSACTRLGSNRECGVPKETFFGFVLVGVNNLSCEGGDLTFGVGAVGACNVSFEFTLGVCIEGAVSKSSVSELNPNVSIPSRLGGKVG